MSECSKCGKSGETYPIYFDGCKELCLEHRWQLVKIHGRTMDLATPYDIKKRVFCKFFSSPDSYHEIMDDLENSAQ